MNPPEQGGAASLCVTLMSNYLTICGSVERQEFPSKTSFDALACCNTQLLVDRDKSLPGTVLADFGLLGRVRRCFLRSG